MERGSKNHQKIDDFFSAYESLFAEEAKSGIHIHIQDSVLNALLEKVPWAEVFESLNNKLSRTEETKHIQEHIYKLAKAESDYDHRQWNNNANLLAQARTDLSTSRNQQHWCNTQLTYTQWQQCHRRYTVPQRRHQQTWKIPKGHQEYTFRHTIIQKVQKDRPKKNQRQRQKWWPSQHERWLRRNQGLIRPSYKSYS